MTSPRNEAPGREVDAANRFLVAVGQEEGEYAVRVMNPPRGPLTQAQALNLAAWLVALADPAGEEFDKFLEAVLAT